MRRHPRTRAYTLGPALIVLGSVGATRLPRRRRRTAGDGTALVATSASGASPARGRRRHGDARCHRSAATARLARPGRRTGPDRTAAGLGLHRLGRRGDDRGLPRLVGAARSGDAGTSAGRSKPSRSCANEGTAWCSTARPATGSSSAITNLQSWTTHADTTSSTRSIVELAFDDYALVHGDVAAEYAVTALTAPVFGPDGGGSSWC